MPSMIGTHIRGKLFSSLSLRMCSASRRSFFCLRICLAGICAASPTTARSSVRRASARTNGRARWLPFPRVECVSRRSLHSPRFHIHPCDLLHTGVIITTDNEHVLPPSFLSLWSLAATKFTQEADDFMKSSHDQQLEGESPLPKRMEVNG
jgi:hypothetical protein